MGKKKRKLLKGVLVAVAVLLVLVLAAGFVAGNILYELALNPHSDKTVVLQAEHNEVDYDEEAADHWQQARDWFDATDYYEIGQTSFDGLALNAYVLENPASANWAVICHGYGNSGRSMAESAQEFYRRGYNIFLPEGRGCGKSEGHYIGMGWYDRLDTTAWIERLNAEYAPENIVLYGVSMGGATVMMTSGEDLPENVRAVVEDCGYTSIWDEFSYQLKGLFGLPAFPLMHFSSVVTRIRAGFWLGEASAIEQLKKSKTPTLFIHGEYDTFVPAAMVQQLYDAAPVPKELLVVPGAGHGGAANAEPELYWGTIDAFLAKYVK